MWVSETYGSKLTTQEVFDIIQMRIGDNYEQWSIYPGVDSQAHKGHTVVAESIVVYQDTKGGFKFIRKSKAKRFPDLRNKIYHETQTILDLAKEISTELFEREMPYEIKQLHLDLGSDEKNCKTYKLQPEIKGWVESMGYEAVFKPYSYAASWVADKASKHSPKSFKN